jgi:hypothetical protein
MFTFKADIVLVDVYRKTPIPGPTIYRPLLFFSDKLNRTGEIGIENGELLEMNKTYNGILITIRSYKDLDPFKEFSVGRNFILKEGVPIIGVGKITQVIGEET